MDKWEDTVMRDEELNSWHLRQLESRRGIAKEQAEISFKAGYEKGYGTALQFNKPAEDNAFKAGEDKGKQEGKQEEIRLVADWMKENAIVRVPFGDVNNDAPEIMVIAPASAWQAFLKEREK